MLTLQPTALVISDFPIVGRTAGEALSTKYQVIPVTWAEFVTEKTPYVSLMIVDVTDTDAESSLKAITLALPQARVVICSLHHNEVAVYRLCSEGFAHEGALRSLLELVA